MDVPPLLHPIPDTVRLTGVGRSTLYREMDAGRLRYVKVGSRRLIPHAALLAWIAALEDGDR